MAMNQKLFRGHGASTGGAAEGGAGEETAVAGPRATCFVSLNFEHFVFIVSQGYCASRPTIYDQVQNQCCQFLKMF